MKKVFIILTALLIFFLPIHNNAFPNEANALVVSKAATFTAKKIVKEVIQDAAVNQAANMAVLEAIEIADKYQAKQGYKIVCPTGGTTCDKPVQVKETLTDTDKTNIKNQSEIELDKLISPDGKGFTKWQKFMDWFGPVWITSLAMAALTYALDDGFRSLLNEAGYNALVAVGIITPIESTPIPIAESPVDTSSTSETESTPTRYPRISEYSSAYVHATNATYHSGLFPAAGIAIDDKLLFESKFYAATTNIRTYHISLSNQMQYDIRSQTISIYKNGLGRPEYIRMAVNGVTEKEIAGTNTTTETADRFDYSLNGTQGSSLLQEQIKSIRSRSPYKVGEFYYTDILYNTVSGKTVEFQIKTVKKFSVTSSNFIIVGGEITPTNQQRKHAAVINLGIPPVKQYMPPPYDDPALAGLDPMAGSSYTDKNGNVALIPPSALTYEEEATGEQVYRAPNPTGDGFVFKKPDGTPVPEESVVPKDTPTVTKNPEGVPQITPAPTPSNPAPEPIPLTPTPTPQPQPETPPGTPPPPIETTEPYFPEGENCAVGLKIPRFLPLLTQISETFPFSIPFDLASGFDAIFSEMGNQRPEFKFAFNFAGKTETWDIVLPPIADSWKKFTDSFLIFIFDIAIVWAVFRFTGGGK